MVLLMASEGDETYFSCHWRNCRFYLPTTYITTCHIRADTPFLLRNILAWDPHNTGLYHGRQYQGAGGAMAPHFFGAKLFSWI